jgi:hypothetical protein
VGVTAGNGPAITVFDLVCNICTRAYVTRNNCVLDNIYHP